MRTRGGVGRELGACGWLLLGTALLLVAASPLERPMPAQPGEVRILRGGTSIAQATLGAALGAAQANDVIELGTGTYTGSFLIKQRPDLTIRAASQAHVVLTNRDPRFAAPNALWAPLDGTPDVWGTTESVGLTIHRPDGRRILMAKDRAQFDVFRAAGIAVA